MSTKDEMTALAQQRAELKAAQKHVAFLLDDVDAQLRAQLLVSPVLYREVVVTELNIKVETSAIPTREWVLNGGFDKTRKQRLYPTVKTIAACLEGGLNVGELEQVFEGHTTLLTQTKNLRTNELAEDGTERELYRFVRGLEFRCGTNPRKLRNTLNALRSRVSVEERRRDSIRERKAGGS